MDINQNTIDQLKFENLELCKIIDELTLQREKYIIRIAELEKENNELKAII